MLLLAVQMYGSLTYCNISLIVGYQYQNYLSLRLMESVLFFTASSFEQYLKAAGVIQNMCLKLEST